MDLVLQAGPVVKLVLLILVYFSLVSWAIIFYKVRVIQLAIKESDRFLDFFWSKKRFDIIGQGVRDFTNSPLAILFREGYHELLQFKKRAAAGSEDGERSRKPASPTTKNCRPTWVASGMSPGLCVARPPRKPTGWKNT